MKKSIVLLVSLFFITAISALIIKNLDDTDSYISEQNSKFSKTQIIFLINNIKDEVSSVIALNNETFYNGSYDAKYKIKKNDVIALLGENIEIEKVYKDLCLL